MPDDMTSDLWLLQGELPVLLQKLGIAAGKDSFLNNHAIMSAAPSVRDLDTVLSEMPTEPRDALPAALHNLCSCPRALHVVRRRRTRPSVELFAVPGQVQDDGERNLDVLRIEDSSSIEISLGTGRAQFIASLAEPYLQLVEPDIALRDMDPLPLSQLEVVLALGDLFRARYPYPDAAWLPDGAIRFDADEVIGLLQTGWAGNDPHSLVTEYAQLTGASWPRLTPVQVKQLLSVMALFEWIGTGAEQFDDESADAAAATLPEYWMSRDLTWFVRCLGWWNNSLRIDLAGPAGRGAGSDTLTIIQATWPWIFEESDESGKREIRTVPIRPGSIRAEIEEKVETLLGAMTADGEAGPATSRPVAPVDAEPIASSCPSCSKAIPDNARFCPDCGSARPAARPVVPISPTCPSCGSPVSPTAKFCTRCAFKLTTS